MGAQARKAGDHLAQGQVLHGNAGLLAHFVQAGLGGGGGLLVLNVDGGGAHDGVAMHGGADQNALAVLAGQLEDGVLHKAAGGAVQQEVIAPAGDDLHGRAACLIVELIRVQTRGVYHHLGLDVALGGVQLPAAVHGGHFQHFGVKLELRAVLGGVLGEGKGQAEGAHNAAGGGVQGGHGVVGDVRLHLLQLVLLHDAQALYPVGHAVFIQLVQGGAVLLAHAHNQAAVLLVVEVQLLGQGGHHPAALHVQFGHEGAVGGVKTGMNDGAVGLGGAAAHVLFPFHHQNVCLVAGKLPGDGTAGNACADDHDVIHGEITPFFLLPLQSRVPKAAAGRAGARGTQAQKRAAGLPLGGLTLGLLIRAGLPRTARKKRAGQPE